MHQVQRAPNRAARLRWLVPWLAGCTVALVFAVAANSGLLRKAEWFLYDSRTLSRARLQPPHPDIRLVTVEENTYEAIPQHSVFWLGRYATLVRELLDAGATVVGMDIMPTYADPASYRAFAETAVLYRGRLVCIAYLVGGTQGQAYLKTPPAALLPALGVENLALANLTRDFDGVERAQAVYPLAHEELGRRSWPFFAATLAERHSGRRLDAASGTFGGVELPQARPHDRRLLVDYSVASFPSWPLEAVLQRIERTDRAFLRENFTGKAVIVGTRARADQDLVDTPFVLQQHWRRSAGPSGEVTDARESTPGVEVQAQILGTLLSGGTLRGASTVVDRGVLVAISLAAALLAFHFGIVGAALSLLSLGTAFTVAAWIAFDHYGVWLNMVAPLLAIPASAACVWAWRYIFEEGERKRLRSTFGRYVSSEVLDEMLADADVVASQSAQRRMITVLFSDINGFSTVCETETPEKVARMLDEHYVEMSKIILAHQGTIIRFIGDQFMVLFGAPRAHPEPERAAVLTALAMLARLEEMRKCARNDSDGFYGVKIGIHSGEMLLAVIGGADKQEYTAVGDSANIAARIQDLCKRVGCPVLASDVTCQRAGEISGVELVDRGSWDVKGRHEAVHVYEPKAAVEEG